MRLEAYLLRQLEISIHNPPRYKFMKTATTNQSKDLSSAVEAIRQLISVNSENGFTILNDYELEALKGSLSDLAHKATALGIKL